MKAIKMNKPIDSVPSEPKQAIVKVKPCEGCGGLPHGPITAYIDCLREALRSTRANLKRYEKLWGKNP